MQIIVPFRKMHICLGISLFESDTEHCVRDAPKCSDVAEQ